MGLKNLTSQLDLVGGTSPVGNMEIQQGPPSQLPITDASQTHIDSLQEVPGGTSNSQYQDLNGEQGPSFNNGSDSTLQQDSLLQQYNYSHGGESGQGGPVPNNSQYQDLNGGLGPVSQLPIDDASQKHIDSLSLVPGFSGNSPFQDLNIDLQQGTPGQYLNNIPD